MPFTASASPTAGLTAYSLERPAKNLDPNSAGVVFARSISRWFGKKRKAANAADSSVRKAHIMTSDIITYDDALSALHKSIDSAFEAPEGDRLNLIHANIDEFCGYTQALTKAAMDESFELGVNRDYAAFGGFDGPEPLAKSLNDVSALAGLLQQAEYMEKRWLGEAEGGPIGWGEKAPGEPLVKAYGDWLTAGKMLLRGIIDDCMPSADQKAADEDLGKVADPEQLAKAADALRSAIERLGAGGRLAKAEGDPPAEGEEDVGEMNPIEAIGRLAAGIVMIADKMLGGGEEEGEEGEEGGEGRMSEEGREAEGDGAAPPPARGEGVTGERNAEERREDRAPPPAAERAPPREEREPPRRYEDDRFRKGDLAKVESRLNSLEAENRNLKAQLAKVGSGPAPAKGSLRVVEKAGDGTLGKGVDIQAEAERLEKMSPEDRALELTRISHRNPIVKIG